MSAELFLVAPADADAEGFCQALVRLLDAEPAAALFLPRGNRDDADYRAFVAAVLEPAQSRDCAVLVDNDADLAKALGADGVHVTGGIKAVKEAIARLKPDMIVGAGDLHSRHDAMMKAEAGVDYVFFGDLDAGAALPEDIDNANWWSDTFEIACVLYEAGRDAGGTNAEFAALGPSVFGAEHSVRPVLVVVAGVTALAFASAARAEEVVTDAPVPAAMPAPIDLPTPVDMPETTDLSETADTQSQNSSPVAAQSTVTPGSVGPVRPVDDAYGAFQRGLYLTALQLALQRASEDDAAAQTLVGEIFANGLGVPVSAAKAAGWYALADKNGDPNASFALAMMYQRGEGVPVNRAKAAELMEKAATAGLPAAQYNMALLYVEGIHVAPNQRKAAELMEKAAEAGLAEAEMDFGTMLLNGAGVAPDLERGASYMRRAAEAGLSDAMVEYATLRYLGKGAARDIESAARWYERAARLGNPVAQNRFAILLAAGEGVDKDLQTAAMWRALARRDGLVDAQTDDLLADISPEDLSMAEERARVWPDQPADLANAEDAPAETGN